jgi:DNA polymerase
LKAQLAALRPRMIVALGKFAAQCLLRDDAPISRLRGAFRSYEGIQLMPTFHPAYLLRDPSKKKEAWDDLKKVNAALKRMGLEPPRPPAG